MFSCCRGTSAVDETYNGAAAAAAISRDLATGAAEEIIFNKSSNGSKADATSTTAAEDDPVRVTEAVAVGCMRPGNSFFSRRSNSSNSNSKSNRDRADSKILRIIDEIEAQAALDEAEAIYGNKSDLPPDEDNDGTRNDNNTINTTNNNESSSREVQQDGEDAMNPFMRYVLNLPESENVSFVQSPKASPSVQVVRRKKQHGEDDDDLNDNLDEGRNPPLYKTPEKGVQAKRMWLQQAFSPEGVGRFRGSPTDQSPSSQRSQQDDGNTGLTTPVAARGGGGGGLVLPSPAPTTYKASGPAPVSSQKPQPVTAGYKDCSASPTDESSYEAWYQKGLLRWRPSKFQPKDAAGSYQRMRSIATLGGSKSDILQDPLVISPVSGTSSHGAGESPENAENQNQNNDATSKRTATDKALPPPPSIPEDPAGGYQHHDSIRVTSDIAVAGGGPLQITTNALLDWRTTQRRRPDPPITSLFSPQKPGTATTRTSSVENNDNTCSSSYLTPRKSRTVPIVSLFGSPTTHSISSSSNRNMSLVTEAAAAPSLTKRTEHPHHYLSASQLSPFDKVEYYSTFVDSYKGYVDDRTSPQAKSMLQRASQELEQVQTAAASTGTSATAAEL